MQVVVIGGGLGGLAAAARLAKLGHAVTLVERDDTLGGAITFETAEGFAWDRGAHSTLLPAVLRDLFRKSGRPLEKELDLAPVETIRHHRFDDGSEVRLPGGSRARQLEAFESLAPGRGQAWVDHVASYADVWETLRRHYLEVPWDPAALPREAARLPRPGRAAPRPWAARTARGSASISWLPCAWRAAATHSRRRLRQ